MPLEKFQAAGVPVLLGTDSLASSPSLDIRDEVAAAKEIHRGFVAPERIESLASALHVFERGTEAFPVDGPTVRQSRE